MKKLMVIVMAAIFLLVTTTVALAYDNWNVGYGYNNGWGRQGTMGAPFAGNARPVDTWNVGYGMDSGYGRHAFLGRYGDGYKRYTVPARQNDFAWTGVERNYDSGRANFRSFGAKSYNPAPRTRGFYRTGTGFLGGRW